MSSDSSSLGEVEVVELMHHKILRAEARAASRPQLPTQQRQSQPQPQHLHSLPQPLGEEEEEEEVEEEEEEGEEPGDEEAEGVEEEEEEEEELEADDELKMPDSPPTIREKVKAGCALPLEFQWVPAMRVSQRVLDPRHTIAQHPNRAKGVTGLCNIGNTCFMNAAVQCLSHTPAVEDYFTSDRFIHHINVENPIGHGGKLAVAFSTLLKRLWSAKWRYFAPTDFKEAVARLNSAFASPMQQDAQEFLAFLLDGLHEDVNRVLKKLYLEKQDPRVAKLPEPLQAQYFWRTHLGRNQSIIVDNFQGQLKSRLKCQTCGTESVAFDPVMYLQLPVQHPPVQTASITYLPANAAEPAVTFKIKVTLKDTIATVRKTLAPYLSPPWQAQPSVQLFALVHQTSIPVPEHLTIDTIKTLTYIAMEVDERLISEEMDIADTMLVSITDDMYPLDQRLLRVHRKTENNELYAAVRATAEGLEDAGELESLSARWGGELFVFDDTAAHDLELIFERLVRSMVREAVLHFTITSKWVAMFTPRPATPELIRARPLKPLQEWLSLESCLRNHNHPEQLDEHNAWHCPKCKSEQCAVKTLTLWTLPRYLVIQLKRMSFSENGFRRKIDTAVKYPLNGLDMKDFLDPAVRETVRDTVYDLYGSVMHVGTAGMGHCTAMVFNHVTKQWLLCNDERVEGIPASEVVNPKAYILFYERRDSGSDVGNIQAASDGDGSDSDASQDCTPPLPACCPVTSNPGL